MSSVSTVCQVQESCLDPILMEPRSLIHKLAPAKQDLSPPWPPTIARNEEQNNSPTEKDCEFKTKDEKPINGWNLIQSLTTNNSYNFRKSTNDPEPVYVHPLDRRSSSALSSKSLEMCTESLGSETGTGIDSSVDAFSNLFEKQSSGPKARESSKKVKHTSNFPPPLTSISGSDGVQVKTHREGGRLVIKAFNFSHCSTYFRAERENGRLRLSLLSDGYRDGENEEEVVEEENVDEGHEDCEENYNEFDNGNLKGRVWGEIENRKEDGKSVGCKIGSGEWASSRCNGDRSGGKRLPSLPFCVAIS